MLKQSFGLLFCVVVFISTASLGSGQSEKLKTQSDASVIYSFEPAEQIRINEFIDSLLEATNGAAAISVAIGYKDQLVYSTQRGYQNLVDSIPVVESSLFRTGSVSKVLASTLLFRFVEGGQVNLDDLIQQWVPQFPEKEHPITIGNLITHTSGIRHYNGYLKKDQDRHTRNFRTLTEALSIFKDDSLLHAPSTKWHYSSYAFNMIQGVLEKITQMPLEQAMDSLMFSPLKMKSTFVEEYGKRHSDLVRSYAWDRQKEKVINARPANPSYKKVAGGFVTNPSDLVRFMMGLDYGRIIDKSTYNLMMKVPYDEFAPWQAYGWRYGERDNGTVVYHHGGTQRGFVAYIVMVPEKEIYVAVMGNFDRFYDVRSNLAYFLVDMADSTWN